MSKKLADLKDANGTSLQSYAETLVDKAIEHDANVVILVAVPPAGLHLISNIPADVVAESLSEMASLMRKGKPKRYNPKLINPAETQTN